MMSGRLSRAADNHIVVYMLRTERRRYTVHAAAALSRDPASDPACARSIPHAILT
jgi:hypothetical protein